MGIFGLGDEGNKKAGTKATKKSDKKPAKAASSQADEAKAILAKMEAKKEAGDCPFC